MKDDKTQEKAIKLLRDALKTMLANRSGPQNDYADIVMDNRETAREVLELTKEFE